MLADDWRYLQEGLFGAPDESLHGVTSWLWYLAFSLLKPYLYVCNTP